MAKTQKKSLKNNTIRLFDEKILTKHLNPP